MRPKISRTVRSLVMPVAGEAEGRRFGIGIETDVNEDVDASFHPRTLVFSSRI